MLKLTSSTSTFRLVRPLFPQRRGYGVLFLLLAAFAAAQLADRFRGENPPGCVYSAMANGVAVLLLALPILPALSGLVLSLRQTRRLSGRGALQSREWRRPLLFALPLALSVIPSLQMGPNRDWPVWLKGANCLLLALVFFLLFTGWQQRLGENVVPPDKGAAADLADLVNLADLTGRRKRPARCPGSGSRRSAGFWPAFFTTIAGLGLNWIFLFPSGSNMDTANQWDQIHGLLRYSDVHAPAHTLYLKALLSVWDSYGAVILFQILAAALLFGLFSRFLAGKGIPPALTCLLILAHLLCMTVSQTYLFPLKDVPYTLCLGAVTLLLFHTLETPLPSEPAGRSGWRRSALSRSKRLPSLSHPAGRSGPTEKEPPAVSAGGEGNRQAACLLSLPQAALLGGCLAMAALFRYNGIVVTAGCGLWFARRFVRVRQWRQLLAMALAALSCAAGVQLCVRHVLRPDSPENGFSIQVFGSGVAAVVAGDGNIRPEEWERIQKILPVRWMEEKYTPWTHSGLIWDWDNDPRLQDPNLRVFNNGFVLAMGAHKAEVIRLYFSLLPRNIGILFRDVLYNTASVYGIYTDNFSSCNGFLTVLLAFSAAALWQRRQWRAHWAVALPILCNMLSIALSTITNEFRYLLPTASLFPFLLLYILAERRRS